MMDSLVIAPSVPLPTVPGSDADLKRDSWLDETYPDLPSVYLPTALHPLDTKSPEYQAALEDETVFRKCASISLAMHSHSPVDLAPHRSPSLAWIVQYLRAQHYQDFLS